MIRPAEIGASFRELAKGPMVPKVVLEDIQQHPDIALQVATRCSSQRGVGRCREDVAHGAAANHASALLGHRGATTVPCSRWLIGWKLFLALAECGESGHVEIIERQRPLPLVRFTRNGLDAAQVPAARQERNIAGTSVPLSNAVQALGACVTSVRQVVDTVSQLPW